MTARQLLERELADLEANPVVQSHGASYTDKFSRGLNDQARAVQNARMIEVQRLLSLLED